VKPRASSARRFRWLAAGAAGLVSAVFAAVAGTAQVSEKPVAGLLDFTETELAQIVAHGPWPPAPRADASNRVLNQSSARAWGASLFFDARLSANGQLSCASCHQPNKAFQDGLTTAVGRTLGQRNTPSLLDAAQWRWHGWDGAHDSLWSASLTPLLSDGEMHQTVPALAQRVRTTPELAAGYTEAFHQPPPSDDVQLVVDLGKALAAYQSTLVSPRTPFDGFRDALARGDVASATRYPMSAQRGLRLFLGEGRCTTCHAGPSFTNGEFGDIGIPFFVPGGVDAGRYKGLEKLLASPYNRLGGFNDAGGQDPRAVSTRHVTLQPRHFGEFRVPSLRQLTHTAPYMHNGQLATLDAVVMHYSDLPEERLHTDGERILRPLELSDQESADLAAFLHSLSH
jgi:cytochrome c peroxidase